MPESNDPALLRAAFETLSMGVMILARDGRVVWQNTSCETLNPTVPDPVRAAVATGAPWSGEIEWRAQAGETNAAAVEVNQIQTGYSVLSFRKIPVKQRRSEEFARLIAENSVDVAWVWGIAERRLLFVSPSIEQLRGFTAEEALEQSMQQALTPESYERAGKLLSSIAAVESGDESARIASGEFDVICKDGSVVATEVVTRLISDETGRVRYVIGVTRDIRERKAAQKALAEAEEKYRTIVDGAMEGIYRTTVEGLPVEVNHATAKMLGYDSAEDLLRNVEDVGRQLWADPAARERFMRLMDEQGLVRDFECEQRRRDGTKIWIAVNSRRVRGPNGEPLYNEGFIEDITERKRMEHALRQSEEKFSKIFATSPSLISIHVLHDGGRLVDVNEAFEQVTGYTREEIVGRTVAELGWLVDEQTEREIVRRLLTEGRIRNLEHHFMTKDGDVRTALLSAERLELDGRVCSLAARFDITSRKQAEARIESLATAIEQAGEQIVITDISGAIEYCNPAFERATGYTRQEVIGQSPRVLKSGKQPREFYENLWSTITSGRVWTGRFANRRKDGSLIEEEATISPVRNKTGNIRAFVAVKRDVSERMHLEQQLRQAQKLESIGRLAGGVAHDFNNLLTVINGYADMSLGKLAAGDPLCTYLEEISKAGQRAAGLTRQLLAFSRKQVLEVRSLDLNAIIRDTERMLRRLIGEDVELKTDLDLQPGKISGDYDQVHQVIMNLAVNARDAMPDGGQLFISTREIEIDNDRVSHPDARPGKFVVLSVTDTGIGMDEQTLDKIFEPFFTTKEQGKGTGLGLSTVYGIVRQNGGWIEVASQPGYGTTFRIYLPVVENEISPVERLEPAPGPHGRETILVVEDQEEVRTLTRRILLAHGYRVLEAAHGAQAFFRAKEYPETIHLLVTDVVMPGINGKELSERLREARPSLKVLFTSGYTSDVIAHRGVMDPNVAYLPKPFTPETLAAKVREVLASEDIKPRDNTENASLRDQPIRDR